MKKLLILIGLITSIYAKQNCIFQDRDVCVYVDKKSQYSNMIIENTSNYPITIIDATVKLDGVQKTINQIVLDKKQKMIVIKSKYENEEEPTYTVGIITYSKSEKQISGNKEGEIIGENGHIQMPEKIKNIN